VNGTPKTLDDIVYEELAQAFSRGVKSEKLLRDALRYLAKWRQSRIDAGLYVRTGGKVATGPFRGMQFVARSTGGPLAPKLLGIYEHELHATIETIATGGYDTVVNIGAAQGYYAVGLALRMPRIQVFAYDTDAAAREGCRQVAAINKVADRIEIGDVFQPVYFSRFEGGKTAVICDIEGDERSLIDPTVSPALAKFDLLVECHDNVAPGLCDDIARRFAATHSIQRIEPSPGAAPVPPEFILADELDALLAIWEWREGPTPWLWMQAK
jgi:hypothetical protein